MDWFNWCFVLFHQYFWQFSHSGISYNKNTNTHIQISNKEHKSVGLVNQLEGLVGRDYKSFAGASEDRLLLAFGSIWTPCNLQIMVNHDNNNDSNNNFNNDNNNDDNHENNDRILSKIIIISSSEQPL